MRKACLYLANTTSMGRGVFTDKKIAANTVIEVAPVIVMSAEDKQHLDKTLLHDYIFAWGADSKQCCMALGWVPMYNHRYKSNCEYFMDFEKATIFVKTVRSIKKDEELTINYNGDWNDAAKVWFDVAAE